MAHSLAGNAEEKLMQRKPRNINVAVTLHARVVTV